MKNILSILFFAGAMGFAVNAHAQDNKGKKSEASKPAVAQQKGAKAGTSTSSSKSTVSTKEASSTSSSTQKKSSTPGSHSTKGKAGITIDEGGQSHTRGTTMVHGGKDSATKPKTASPK